ncbi:MAG: hypothetical protein PF569_10110 [Candidatus Woesearchaeota archaeon]|jgi:TolA-binding protein|nr:hypothetical protein [Candidatus Woesearchaeota archaeon]
MKKILMLILISIIISGCTTMQGMKSINISELSDKNQSEVEQFITKGTELENQNITIASSILITIDNLKKLQKELDNLNENIENISQNLETIENEQRSNQESAQYLNYLNSLVNQSNNFIESLQDSTKFWSKYLIKTNQSKDNLNYTDDSDNQGIVDSITKPLKSFE